MGRTVNEVAADLLLRGRLGLRETHSEKGWPHDDCAGPGMPCPRCYPDGTRPPLPPDWESFASVDDDE